MFRACGTWLFGLQVVGLVWSSGLCVRFAGYCSTGLSQSNSHLYNSGAPDDGHSGAPKHVEQTVSFAIKNQSVASTWPFISTQLIAIYKHCGLKFSLLMTASRMRTLRNHLPN